MKSIVSYNCKITNLKDVIKPTMLYYRQALEFLIPICNLEYDNYCNLGFANEKQSYIENKTHQTKQNPNPKYDFDSKFYKFPSYLRRCAISEAVGIVSSYRSNLQNYEDEREYSISNGKKFKKKPPKLQVKHFKFPVFYKGNMYERISSNETMIKLYHKNDWVWFSAKLRNQDIKYITKNITSDFKELSPTLEGQDRKYYLKFGFEKNIKLKNTKLKDQKVLSVDLGINTSAVCSIIDYNGTVLGRKFINQPKEKDRMYHLCNKLKKVANQSGTKSPLKSIWRKINNLNTQVVNNTVNQIFKIALANNVDVIVFEYLNFTGGKKKGTLKKTQLWAKRKIQEKVKTKAHLYGIRYARVCAKNTSQLAYDGSGTVIRNRNKYSLCKFKNGKQYNCDLSASYNIGARYFINSILKTLSVKKELVVRAEVPVLQNRTKSTLSTLWKLSALV